MPLIRWPLAIRTALAVIGGSAALVGLSVMPAQASNPVLNHLSASAKYVDLTDNLCARTNDSSHYAEALIMSGSRIVFRVTDTKSDGKYRCTGNLSIPEDEQYTLVVSSCSKSTDACAGKNTTFRS